MYLARFLYQKAKKTNNKDMKNKKTLRKITKVNIHKRKSRERAKNALLRAIEETNVGTDALRISFSRDEGRRGRVAAKPRRDEHIITGIFSSSKSGFGFVAPDEEYKELCDRDIFIPEDKTLGAIDGDRVEAVFHFYTSRFGESKTEGRIRKIIEYGRRSIIGTLTATKPERRGSRRFPKKYLIIPDDSKIAFAPEVRDIFDAEVGDKVEALIVRGEAEHGKILCDVIRSFGAAESKSANYEAILAECEIPTEFSEAELAEAKELASTCLSDEGRVRRSEIIFTIDGEGAKDLDDAISLKKTAGGWQLGVHIADVSAYVREKSALDRAVMARGTSVYFTDKVVPMLPHALSNGACSLNAGEEKYALSAIISLDKNGEIKGAKIEPSIIISRVRGVYSEVNRIFDGTADAQLRKKYREVIPTLNKMRELYLVLLEKSRKRGSMELESSEAEIILDENGNPSDIVKRERGDAERLIEQFMLTANEAVARLLSERQIPCVYRVHENPPPEKLSDFLNYMHNLGFNTSVISREKAEPSDFSALLELARQKELLLPVSYTMLRAMSKAKYSDKRQRHFGLSLDYYCHFTSPIRRLSDLATHRIIHKVLLEGKRAEGYAKYAYRAAAAATEAELRALGAERRIENLYKVIYMSDKVGEEFSAIITSVTSFGFFAELDNTCEGLVPIEELCGFFTFDEKNLTIRSRDTVYKIGDTVKVRLEEADIIRGKLRFSVLDTEY